MRGTNSEGAGLAAGSCTGSGAGVGVVSSVDVGDDVHATKASNINMATGNINSLK